MVTLRPFEPDDAPRLAELANNENISRNLRDAFPHPYTLADAEKFIKTVNSRVPATVFAIEWNGEYVGNIGLHRCADAYRMTAEIGYFIGEPYWGKGIATEAVRLMTEFGFRELGLLRIHTGVFEYNPASMKVLEKCGYERDGVFKKAVLKNGKIWDEVRYSKINGDRAVSSQNRETRIGGLVNLFHAIVEKKDPVGAIRHAEQLLTRIIPSDVIFVVDELVKEGIPMEELKTGINKFLNQLHKAIRAYPQMEPAPGSFADICFRNNAELDKKLKTLRPSIQQLNFSSGDLSLINEIKSSLEDLLRFSQYYVIKENVLFPVLEQHWPNFRCLGVMWSFHDDIRKDLGRLIGMLTGTSFEIRDFNRLIGRVYFNMYAIKFREEAILFPYAAETLPPGLLDSLLNESLELGFPYYNPGLSFSGPGGVVFDQRGKGDVDLNSGSLDVERIRLIFNHLPVDITYVDENNKVKYFSTPKKRIFPRSNSVIGRDVRNCHPPESVHVVEEIVEAFRSGKENKASFWIRMKGELVLIEYYAVRDAEGTYRGVIEVSQEVSEIQKLEGERRLIRW